LITIRQWRCRSGEDHQRGPGGADVAACRERMLVVVDVGVGVVDVGVGGVEEFRRGQPGRPLPSAAEV